MMTFHPHCPPRQTAYRLDVDELNWHLLVAVVDKDSWTIPCPKGCGQQMLLNCPPTGLEELPLTPQRLFQAANGLMLSDLPVTMEAVDNLLKMPIEGAELRTEKEAVYLSSLKVGGYTIYLIAGRLGAQISYIRAEGVK